MELDAQGNPIPAGSPAGQPTTPPAGGTTPTDTSNMLTGRVFTKAEVNEFLHTDLTDDELLNRIKADPEKSLLHLKQSRGEARERRIANQELQAKLQSYETEKREREIKQLEDEKDYQAAKARLESEVQTTVTMTRKQLIDAKVESFALRKGIPASAINSVLQLMDRDGIAIAADGSISGVDEALNRTFEKHEAVLAPLVTRQAAAAPGTPANGQQAPVTENPADKMFLGATGMTYGEMRRLGAAGADPPANQGAGQQKKVDVSKMTDAEYRAYKSSFVAGLAH